MKKLVIILSIATTFFYACTKNDDSKPQSTSCTLRYELTGNFSGSNMLAVYTTESGGTVTEQIILLPWNKQITFDPTVGGANVVISGASGIAGQQVTMVIKKGGNQFGTPITATADALGTFTISSPVIIF